MRLIKVLQTDAWVAPDAIEAVGCFPSEGRIVTRIVLASGQHVETTAPVDEVVESLRARANSVYDPDTA